MKVEGLTRDMAEDLATPQELARVQAGEDMVVYMIATNIDDTVSAKEKKLVTKVVTAAHSGAKVAQYLDFSMFKRIGDDKATKLTDLKGHRVTITITVPKAFRAPKGVKRTFYIMRVHDGKAKIIASGTGNKVKVKIDKFSTYAPDPEGGPEQQAEGDAEGREVRHEAGGPRREGALLQHQRQRGDRGRQWQGEGHRQGQLHDLCHRQQRRAQQREGEGEVGQTGRLHKTDAGAAACRPCVCVGVCKY